MATPPPENPERRRKSITNTGRYSPNQYVASFVGFAPVNEPAVTILVVLDSPVGAHHGGEVGGPVFKRIAEQVLAYLDVPHDVPVNARSATETAKNTPTAPAAEKFGATANQEAAKHEAANRKTRRLSRCSGQKRSSDESGGKSRVAGESASGAAPTMAFSEEDAVEVPDLSGQTVRARHRNVLAPGFDSVADWQRSCTRTVAGSRHACMRGSTVTVRFGRAAAKLEPATRPMTTGGARTEYAEECELKSVVEGGPKVQSATRRQKKRAGMEMELAEVIAGIERVRLTGGTSLRITAVACDSRKVTAGTFFFALPGAKTDGNEFVADALARGAVAIASPQPRPADLAREVTWVELTAGTVRKALALAAANFYGHPADALKLVGVTGTNGKTTITFILDSILRAAGLTTGRIGTTGYQTPRGSRIATNTTPESLDLQQMFAEVRDAGGTHAVLEVSSHALAMDRIWGCHFAVAIFTNLTRDHLNFHKTFEEYFAAKRLLFAGTGAGAPDAAVINTDDPYAAACRPRESHAHLRINGNGRLNREENSSLSFTGLEFTAQTPAGKIEVRSSLVGRINVYNILAAIGAALALEIPVAKIEDGIRNLELVPGRFQRIDEGQPFLVVVDYAHADDALRNLIATARELNPAGSIITLFGAGGERDRSTRPPMGEAAGSLSDLVILTSDNPRSEDPLRIINDVVVGLQKVNAQLPHRAGPRRAPWKLRSTRPSPATSCCWPEKATKIIRFCATAPSNSTIAKKRAPFCAAAGYVKKRAIK